MNGTEDVSALTEHPFGSGLCVCPGGVYTVCMECRDQPVVKPLSLFAVLWWGWRRWWWWWLSLYGRCVGSEVEGGLSLSQQEASRRERCLCVVQRGRGVGPDLHREVRVFLSTSEHLTWLVWLSGLSTDLQTEGSPV